MRRDRYRSIDRSIRAVVRHVSRASIDDDRAMRARPRGERARRDGRDGRSIDRSRDRSRSVDVERPRNDDGNASDIIRVVSETARKFKLALFRAFFGEGLEYIEGAGGGARGGRETGDGECVDAW